MDSMGGCPCEHKQIAEKLHALLYEMTEADSVCNAEHLPYGSPSKKLGYKEH